MRKKMSKRAIDRWQRLQSTGAGDGVIEVPSIDSRISTGYGTVRYAIGTEGQPRLLVPIGFLSSPRGLTSTSKLSVSAEHFNISGRRTTFIDIMCMDRSLDIVFAELAEEVLRRIEDGLAPQVAVAESIEDFRELLREEHHQISDSIILGVVGELEVLRRIAVYSPEVLVTWVGPFEQRHDFRRGCEALEVKTSGRADATLVSINGIEQLAAPANGTLHLVHVRLERVEGGSITVGSLFDSLLELGCEKRQLKNSLAALECDDPYSQKWNRLAFSPEGLSCYQIVEGFPRIVGSSFLAGILPAGLSAVEYRLDLAHTHEFMVSESATEKVFARIAR